VTCHSRGHGHESEIAAAGPCPCRGGGHDRVSVIESAAGETCCGIASACPCSWTAAPPWTREIGCGPDVCPAGVASGTHFSRQPSPHKAWQTLRGFFKAHNTGEMRRKQRCFSTIRHVFSCRGVQAHPQSTQKIGATILTNSRSPDAAPSPATSFEREGECEDMFAAKSLAPTPASPITPSPCVCSQKLFAAWKWAARASTRRRKKRKLQRLK